MTPNPLSVSAVPIDGRSWKKHVQQALQEDDPAKLLQCIHATETALFLRWQQLDKNVESEELLEMQSAASISLAIKVHKLGWPGLSATIALVPHNTPLSILRESDKGGPPLIYRHCTKCNFDFIGTKRQTRCASCRTKNKVNNIKDARTLSPASRGPFRDVRY